MGPPCTPVVPAYAEAGGASSSVCCSARAYRSCSAGALSCVQGSAHTLPALAGQAVGLGQRSPRPAQAQCPSDAARSAHPLADGRIAPAPLIHVCLAVRDAAHLAVRPCSRLGRAGSLKCALAVGPRRPGKRAAGPAISLPTRQGHSRAVPGGAARRAGLVRAVGGRAWSLHARQPLLTARRPCPAAAGAGSGRVHPLRTAAGCQHACAHAAVQRPCTPGCARCGARLTGAAGPPRLLHVVIGQAARLATGWDGGIASGHRA